MVLHEEGALQREPLSHMKSHSSFWLAHNPDLFFLSILLGTFPSALRLRALALHRKISRVLFWHCPNTWISRTLLPGLRASGRSR